LALSTSGAICGAGGALVAAAAARLSPGITLAKLRMV
jgi:hypothetical protein